MQAETFRRWARYAWAAPCSLAGLLLSLPWLLGGARARWVRGVFEVALAHDGSPRRHLLRRLPFAAITLGHVVIGLDRNVLTQLRPHEHAHVRQYELWGPVFLLAYPVSSLIQLLRGRRPYWHNHFEVQARTHEKAGRHSH